MDLDLDGKVALVTGGSRGLGRAMCHGLAREGVKVALATRKLEACEAVAAEIAAQGGEALPLQADMGRMAELDALLDKVYAHFGRLDILINNAGMAQPYGGLSDVSEEIFDEVFAVNLKGPWYLASRAAPRMGETGGGSIINVISVSAFETGKGIGFYSASKVGLKMLTQVMAQEWAAMGIRVNALAPGTYVTDMLNKGLEIPGFEEASLQAVPMKRFADPEEIVGSVLYLASHASSYTTGQALIADGGRISGLVGRFTPG